MENVKIFQDIINYILGLGSAIFVPLIILILGLVAGMKFKKAFMSAITLGIAFTGYRLYVECGKPGFRSVGEKYRD